MSITTCSQSSTPVSCLWKSMLSGQLITWSLGLKSLTSPYMVAAWPPSQTTGVGNRSMDIIKMVSLMDQYPITSPCPDNSGGNLVKNIEKYLLKIDCFCKDVWRKYWLLKSTFEKHILARIFLALKPSMLAINSAIDQWLIVCSHWCVPDPCCEPVGGGSFYQLQLSGRISDLMISTWWRGGEMAAAIFIRLCLRGRPIHPKVARILVN